MPIVKRVVIAAILLAAIAITIRFIPLAGHVRNEISSALSSSSIQLIESPDTHAERIVNGAKREVLNGVTYDASYKRMKYPGGDVAPDRGACTDVVVRALRAAGYDLQKLIHEDKAAYSSAYPKYPSGLDSNIDHRRVPNHIAFFRRHGQALPTSTTGNDAESWQAGDFVYWKYGNLDHCGVISNDRGPSGLPLVIHNLGVTVQEDCLRDWPIKGHFRFPAGTI